MSDADQYRQFVDAHRSNHGSVVLELGCGDRKVDPTSIGIDILPAPGVDIVADALEVLAALEPGSVDEIFSAHFLEHISDARGMLEACARVLRSGARFRAIIPHFSNPYFYSDPTHDRAYGLYTFSYLVAETFTRRGVPHYEAPLPFRYSNAIYAFKSSRPHYVRHGFKQIGRVFNVSTWMKELYEENWCWKIPAYEVDYELTRL
jgi:ubiquinone/menaquinone biosynthesis C-methylase UbiE